MDKISELEWRRHIQQWQFSGLPAVRYCLDNDLPYSSFGRRKRKYFQEQEEQLPAGWCQVQLDNPGEKDEPEIRPAPAAEESVRIILPHNVILEVKPGFSKELLTEVMEVLSSWSSRQ